MGGPRLTNTDRNRLCKAVFIDGLPIDKARHLHPLAEKGVSYSWDTVKQVIERYKALVPEEASERLRDVELRRHYERMRGLSLPVLSGLGTERREESDSGPHQSQIKVSSTVHRKRIDRIGPDRICGYQARTGWA